MQKHPITKEGATALMKELDTLKRQDRPRVIKLISEAREDGDLKNNTKYHAASEEQTFIESRINELELKLNNLQIIDVRHMKNASSVMFGTTIHLFNTATNDESIYKIVGEDEADLSERKISYKSPLAQALIGKSIDEVVEVETPGGTVKYEISDIIFK